MKVNVKKIHIVIVNIAHVPDQPSCYTERAIESGRMTNVIFYR